jgi:integrase
MSWTPPGEGGNKRECASHGLQGFSKGCEQAHLPDITPHGLRHTHATMLLSGGHSVNAVAERLGDTPETISMIYGHVTPRNQLEILRTIEQVYGQ